MGYTAYQYTSIPKLEIITFPMNSCHEVSSKNKKHKSISPSSLVDSDSCWEHVSDCTQKKHPYSIVNALWLVDPSNNKNHKQQLWPFISYINKLISYNCLFSWDFTFYKWADFRSLITGITRVTLVKSPGVRPRWFPVDLPRGSRHPTIPPAGISALCMSIP